MMKKLTLLLGLALLGVTPSVLAQPSTGALTSFDVLQVLEPTDVIKGTIFGGTEMRFSEVEAPNTVAGTVVEVRITRAFSQVPPASIYVNRQGYEGYVPLLKLWRTDAGYYGYYQGIVLKKGPGALR